VRTECLPAGHNYLTELTLQIRMQFVHPRGSPWLRAVARESVQLLHIHTIQDDIRTLRIPLKSYILGRESRIPVGIAINRRSRRFHRVDQ
jgi:hypothetical protein